MTTASADPVRAVARVLRADTATLALVDNDTQRIYMDDFDETEEAGEERTAVIVRLVGGDVDASYLPLQRYTVDVFAYGKTASECRRLSLTIMHTLKAEGTTTSHDGEFLYSIVLQMPPLSMRERTGRKYFVTSWSVLMGDKP